MFYIRPADKLEFIQPFDKLSFSHDENKSEKQIKLKKFARKKYMMLSNRKILFYYYHYHVLYFENKNSFDDLKKFLIISHD